MRCNAPCADAPQSNRAKPCACKSKDKGALVNLVPQGNIILGQDCIVAQRVAEATVICHTYLRRLDACQVQL
jgi:hypothetical protein